MDFGEWSVALGDGFGLWLLVTKVCAVLLAIGVHLLKRWDVID
jgi:hypothetical protein